MQYGQAGSFLSLGSWLQSKHALPAQCYSSIAGALWGDRIPFTPEALLCFSSTGTLLNLHEESKALETIREKEIIVLRHVLKYHCVDVLDRWGMQWPSSGSPGCVLRTRLPHPFCGYKNRRGMMCESFFDHIEKGW